MDRSQQFNHRAAICLLGVVVLVFMQSSVFSQAARTGQLIDFPNDEDLRLWGLLNRQLADPEPVLSEPLQGMRPLWRAAFAQVRVKRYAREGDRVGFLAVQDYLLNVDAKSVYDVEALELISRYYRGRGFAPPKELGLTDVRARIDYYDKHYQSPAEKIRILKHIADNYDHQFYQTYCAMVSLAREQGLESDRESSFETAKEAYRSFKKGLYAVTEIRYGRLKEEEMQVSPETILQIEGRNQQEYGSPPVSKYGCIGTLMRAGSLHKDSEKVLWELYNEFPRLEKERAALKREIEQEKLRNSRNAPVARRVLSPRFDPSMNVSASKLPADSANASTNKTPQAASKERGGNSADLADSAYRPKGWYVIGAAVILLLAGAAFALRRHRRE